MNNPLFHDNDVIYFSKWDPIQHPPQLKSSKGHQSLVVHILIRNCQYAKNKQTNKHCSSMQLLHWIMVAKAEMGLKATLTITIYGKKCHIFKWDRETCQRWLHSYLGQLLLSCSHRSPRQSNLEVLLLELCATSFTSDVHQSTLLKWTSYYFCF